MDAKTTGGQRSSGSAETGPAVATSWFRRLAAKVAEAIGSPYAFSLALATVLVWAALGPHFGWSETHQLIINTFTTIVTFLIVFLIQNTQNRDTKSLHLKIDELLKATRGARNSMIDLDRLSDEQLARLENEFKEICGMEPLAPAGGLSAAGPASQRQS